MHDLEVQRVAEEIRNRKAEKVLVQLPDGLRPRALSLAEELTRLTGAEVLLSGDSCYGACDLATNQAATVGADLIVHYGHSRMLEDAGIPVVYVEAKMNFDAARLVEEALPLVEGWKRIGLAATVQHVHRLDEVAETLRRSGHQPITGKGKRGTPNDGQILGCDYATATSVSDEVDGYLFIGGGMFHPLGLALATGRPVVKANPYTMQAEELRRDDVRRLAMRRMAVIAAAKDADRFGIIVSLKPGQFGLTSALSLRDRLRLKGRTAAIICLDEAGPAQLGNFTEAQAFINTACPRIALDGVAGVKRPILNVREAEVMLGERRWEDAWGPNYFS